MPARRLASLSPARHKQGQSPQSPGRQAPLTVLTKTLEVEQLELQQGAPTGRLPDELIGEGSTDWRE